MENIEKAKKGVRDHLNHECTGCPYEDWKPDECLVRLCVDADRALEMAAQEIAELEATVHNLRLYLTVLKGVVPEEVWTTMENRMSGLPGYVEVRKKDDD